MSPRTPLPSIASSDAAFAVSTIPRGVFNSVAMTAAALGEDGHSSSAVGVESCGTYNLESLFHPFAQAATCGDLDLSKVISPASFYNLADSLSLEAMFEAAREGNFLDEAAAAAVPDIDDNGSLTASFDDVLASVPSSLVEDMNMDVQVPSSSSCSRRRRRSSLHRATSAATSSRKSRGVTATAATAKPKRGTGGRHRVRAPKVAVPDEKKDAKYWARREKNNAAARRNRMLKRQEKTKEKSKLPVLTAKNEELVDEVMLLKQELRGLREALRERLIREGLASA